MDLEESFVMTEEKGDDFVVWNPMDFASKSNPTPHPTTIDDTESNMASTKQSKQEVRLWIPKSDANVSLLISNYLSVNKTEHPFHNYPLAKAIVSYYAKTHYYER